MKKYTDKEKEEIIAYYHKHGLDKTCKKYGIGNGTIYLWIKPGHAEKARERTRKWSAGKGKQIQEKHHKKYHEKNPTYDKDHKREYLKDEKNLERKREREREYHKHKMQTDINYRLRKSLRSRVSSTVVKNGHTKSERTLKLVGCTISQLREHLEKQFKSGMSWDNYGVKGWHIDHIRPVASFDLTDKKQQEECFHFSNLQPLWAVENLEKGDRILE